MHDGMTSWDPTSKLVWLTKIPYKVNHKVDGTDVDLYKMMQNHKLDYRVESDKLCANVKQQCTVAGTFFS